MESTKRIEIDAVIIRMLSRQGFVEVFWEELQAQRKIDPKTTQETVFYKLNEKYYNVVGEYRYSSYDSFRNCMNRR